ncbi:MAG: hypothetical protein IPG32_16720 [Saprospirales bacterium]|nr:hypothetical protein [Saprospirales bacterium]
MRKPAPFVYDSGDDFEKIAAENPYTAPIFNADNEGNGFKGRSRARDPSPKASPWLRSKAGPMHLLRWKESAA